MPQKRKAAEMETSTKWDYTLDPQGDTVLVLMNPDASSAAWKEEPRSDGTDRHKDEDIDSDSADNEIIKKEDPKTPDDRTGSGLTNTATAAKKSQYTYLVSSHHLKLASPYFEGSEEKFYISSDKYDGLFHDEFSDYDHEAFLIALQIIHGRFSEVPKAVSIVMLAKVALLVHDFETHGAASFCMSTWISTLSESNSEPWSDARIQVMWLFIVWVAKDREQCSDAFHYIVEEGKHAAFPDLGLPVPKSLLKACLDCRLELMTRLRARYIGLIDRLVFLKEPGMGQCRNPTCAAFLLGLFYSALARQGIDLVRLQEPFEGRAYDSVRVKFQGVLDVWLPKHQKPVCHIRTMTKELMAKWKKDKDVIIQKAWAKVVDRESWLNDDE